ncbi:MAG: TonB-dependent receptor [Bacteroidales bacterium]|nr:TonB-dependent receptor [Bacteroidales bacterium]
MKSKTIQLRKLVLFLVLMILSFDLLAQVTVTGVVTDESGNSLPGVNVFEKGTTNGTITDLDGKYMLRVQNGTTITFSFIGYDDQEFSVSGTKQLNVVLKESTQEIEEVVVVGYGQQKKASVVGAITQTTGEQLQRAAGVPDLGQALTGNLPGLVTMQSTGLPGQENPDIVIRGSSSWNSSAPLVLVDGIERPMSSVDVNSVASISVLKDASATAIYGVKGANGVIIITTKRGNEGRAQINASVTTTMKVVSKLPGKLDSYDALMARNVAIENELNLSPESWSSIENQAFINNYRYRNSGDRDELGNLLTERYPNVDWQDELFKSHAMSYSANVNIAGGSKFVRYYSSLDWVNESDMFKRFENNRGYKGGYAYNRINVRSNLDFNITKTTVLKTNLSGSVGLQNTPWSNNGYSGLGDWALSQQWAGAYNIAPNIYVPRYEDGSWGANMGWASGFTNATNSERNMAYGDGTNLTTTTNIATDVILEQDLKFITKGLSFTGLISWDNRFTEKERGVTDLYHDPKTKIIDPHTGLALITPAEGVDATNKYDFADPVEWTTASGNINHWSAAPYRNLNYSFRLNYDRSFDKHNVTLMGLFERQEQTFGSEIPRLRENWCFRVTYNWNNRYFLEYNGAYNGSEKFADANRFAFFNSGALGWTISNEPFMDHLRESGIIENFKLRASYGEIGDDSYNGRWLYLSTWGMGGNALMNGYPDNNQGSIYQYYFENAVGNEDIHWEVVRKLNFGVDYSFLKGMFRGSFDIFRDHRTDIIIGGSDRAVPVYFGMNAPTANLGEVKTRGYEWEIKFNKDIKAVKGLSVWANLNMSHAQNEIIEREDKDLLPAYRMQAGYAIGQTRSQLDNGFLQTYDDVYASPRFDSKDNTKIPGDYYYIDFNGDGIINSDDNAPIYFSNIPQNTYNATLGINYKGWAAFVQFYGVNNVTRDVALGSFGNNHMDNVYDLGTWWANDHNGADLTTPRYLTYDSNRYGTQFLYDASYLRLKNAEISYTFASLKVGRYTFKNVKIYLNGNNLWVYTKMPDDRESNLSGVGYQGQYPTVKRFTLGLKFSL